MGQTGGETGSVLMGVALLSKSLIQFSVLVGAMFPPAIYLPNNGGSNEDNNDLLQQKIPVTQCSTQ